MLTVSGCAWRQYQNVIPGLIWIAGWWLSVNKGVPLRSQSARPMEKLHLNHDL